MFLSCGHLPSQTNGTSTGYGVNAKGETFCYKCCAEQDKKQMRETGKIILYLTYDNVLKNYSFFDGKISNWPNSLIFNCRVKQGKHNIAKTRYDAWFVFEGYIWHGVQYGENTQILHCRKTKQKI